KKKKPTVSRLTVGFFDIRGFLFVYFSRYSTTDPLSGVSMHQRHQYRMEFADVESRRPVVSVIEEFIT
ncbi:MAG: hypothetical protein PVH24_08155, partial [Candidatus Zixiibacteriota bacterium]